MKLKKLIESEEYSVNDFMDEFSEPVVYLAGDSGRNGAKSVDNYNIALYPCALDINGNWIRSGYYDLTTDQKSKIFITDKSELEDLLKDGYYHPDPNFITYGIKRVPEKALEEIGKAIESTIGFDKYFDLCMKLKGDILKSKSNKPELLWF